MTAADLDVLRRDWTLNTNAAQGGRTGPNRALKRLRHFFNWAVEKGYTERSPFKRGHVNTLHFAKEPGRTRRLEGDEEQRLLKAATTPLLKALIVAGLETGCRIRELLKLTWADVKLDANVLVLPAAITKTNEPRDVPITQHLRALLDMRGTHQMAPSTRTRPMCSATSAESQSSIGASTMRGTPPVAPQASPVCIFTISGASWRRHSVSPAHRITSWPTCSATPTSQRPRGI